MIIPTKYEDLNKNVLIISAEIIKTLKSKSYSFDELYSVLKKDARIDLTKYLECLIFLYFINCIENQDNYIFIKGVK